jgi:phosphopantothenoylcysteine decarboxylase/phosphopantothenate--cysteine ligase
MKIVVGITGGIAAYKAVSVVRAFVLAGHSVQVVATDAALRFVGKPTLEAISRNPVYTDLYDGVAEVRHVAIGQAADLIVVAPATANFLAQLAGGLAPDLLGNTILASTAPLVVAPAMHTGMWENAATRANISVLRDRGVTVVGPAVGQLTGADTGAGRMSEPDEIVATALSVANAGGDLAGRKILVTAGGTREPLDPVRFIGNRSSGRQGVAIALAAAAQGRRSSHWSARTSRSMCPSAVTVQAAGTRRPSSPRCRPLVHSGEARTSSSWPPPSPTTARRPSPRPRSRRKRRATPSPSRSSGIPTSLRDLVCDQEGPGRSSIGFAAETETDEEALRALVDGRRSRAKGCDYLVVNSVGWTTGFATEGNAVTNPQLRPAI